MKRFLCAVTGAAAVAAACPAMAQATDAVPVATAEPAPAPPVPAATIRLPMNTPVVIAFVEQLSSKSSRIDDMFPIRLVRPIEVGGRELVPAGAMGMGQVVHAAKAGWGGKAGELIVTARYIEHGGVRIPLRRFRMGEPSVGEVRTDEAFLASAAVSPVLGFLINGGEKIVVPGTHANAIVAADTELPAEASAPAPSPSN